MDQISWNEQEFSKNKIGPVVNDNLAQPTHDRQAVIICFVSLDYEKQLQFLTWMFQRNKYANASDWEINK